MESTGSAICKPQFLKVLFSEDLLKLAIPPEFNKHIEKDDLKIATVLSPLGKCWNISIQREARRIYFGNGWQHFVKSHDLTMGQVIAFCYHGDQIFTFIIFDHNACEVEFVPIHLKNSNPMKERIELEHVNHSWNDDRKSKACSQEKQVKESSAPSVRLNQSPSVEKLHSVERVIKKFNLNHWQMEIPLVFCRLNGILNLDEIILRDPKGRLWPTNIFHGSDYTKYRLTKGWREFVLSNQLQVGDTCVFQLENKGKDVFFNVKILR